LVKFNAKIEEYELEYIFLILTATVFEFVFKLFKLVELIVLVGEEGMTDLIVDDGYLFIRILLIQ
jgi:hypothetical protein